MLAELAELTEDKVGVKPNGELVAATLCRGNRHPVAERHDDWLVLIGADGTRYQVPWKGVRLVREGE